MCGAPLAQVRWDDLAVAGLEISNQDLVCAGIEGTVATAGKTQTVIDLMGRYLNAVNQLYEVSEKLTCNFCSLPRGRIANRPAQRSPRQLSRER